MNINKNHTIRIIINIWKFKIPLKKMSSQSNIDSWLETVKNGGVLPERDLRILCEKIKEILIEESNVQPV
jgi:hypothetical protein